MRLSASSQTSSPAAPVAEPVAEPPEPAGAGPAGALLRLVKRPSSYLYLVAVAICAQLAASNNSYNLFLASTIVVYAVAAMGQDWLIGRAGQVSIGGAAFVGIGAFTTVATNKTPLEHFPIPLLISAVAGAIVGLVVGLPASRLGGLYLVLTTLALEFVFSFVAERHQGQRLGGIAAPNLSLFGKDLSGARSMFLVDVVVLLLVLVLLHNLYRYSPGNMWRAIRDDPLATGTIGISVTRWRLLAFVGSSAVTAVAGSLFAYLVGVASYTTFTLDLGISLIVMVYLGGVGSPIGVIVGAAAVTYLPNLLVRITNLTPTGSSTNNWLQNNSGTLETMVYGVVLILVLLFEPKGLAGIGGRLVALVGRLARRTPPPVPAPAVPEAAAGISVAPTSVALRLPSPRPAPDRAAGALLAVEGLTVRYPNGGTGAADIDLYVPPKSIVAVVGRNGAGKTSTLRGIAGFLRSERTRVTGHITWQGKEIARSSPRRTGQLGIALVPERFKVFPSLTVAEHFRACGLSAKQEQQSLEQFSGLQRFVNTTGGLLSGGERQLLAIALATARKPDLLLVDELSLGLSPVATQLILDELVAAQANEGFAILLVDQAAGKISKVVDYYYLLEGGSIIGEGSSDQISAAQLRETVMGH